VSYSNTSISACVVDTAVQLLGNDRSSIFDGGWQEYSKVEEPKLHDPTWDAPSKCLNPFRFDDDQLKFQRNERFGAMNTTSAVSDINQSRFAIINGTDVNLLFCSV
jgi:hypothetical protein